MSPMSLNPLCKIWYVGAHTHGEDGVELQNAYRCDMIAFEPVPSFFKQLKENWKDVPRSKLHQYGIGSSTRIVNVQLEGQGTFDLV